MKVFAIHLLNDYSGSPKVLMQLARGWVSKGIDVTIVTAGKSKGFLNNINGANYIHYWYRWKANRWLRLVNLVTSQFLLFLKMLISLKRNDVVYVNTVLPFGAALAGKLRGSKVFYHVHETSMSPAILKSFLFSIMRYSSTDVIYVSKYLMQTEPAPGRRMHLLSNALEKSFIEKAVTCHKEYQIARNILMICSLKPYKGVYEFISLARRCPDLKFRLVVNASTTEVKRFIADTNPSMNVEVYPVQTDVHPFYAWADVVLNLSRPKEWIETFGLTIIEAYAYGLPVIVPPVGGIADLVEEGSTGFHIDSSNIDKLVDALHRFADSRVYGKFSSNASKKIFDFTEAMLIENSLQILNGKAAGNSFHVVERVTKKIVF